VRELIERLAWLRPSVRRRYPATPWPWMRCHCGALADIHDLHGQDWCSPCKYAMHDTCECSWEVSDGRA
jgi:hypothetical protein